MPSVYLRPEEDTTDAPFRRTVGQEFEYSSGAQLCQWLGERGLCNNRLHGYGCDCSGANDYLIHGTSDCSASGGEYLIGGSNGVLFGSPIYYQATLALAEGCLAVMPGVSSSVGGHTHVFSEDLSDTQKRRLVRNYLAVEDQLVVLMAGSLDRARNNGNVEPRLRREGIMTTGYRSEPVPNFWTCPADELRFALPSRPTLNFHTSTGCTVEFRAWNTTRAQWRMVLSACVSAALVEAAKQGRDAQEGENLIGHLEGLLQPEMIALTYRQFKAKNH